jgi:endonuclease G
MEKKMKKLILIGCFLLTLLIPIGCNASGCPELYNGNPIEVKGTVELCNTFFVSLYDKQNQRVIVVAEHLKPNKITVPRKDAFRADDRIGPKPNPTQYASTGYDKGHMAPAGDASSIAEMYETFLMTNMTPQKPTLNREAWRMLEEHTRTLLSQSKSDMYVVNIAVYNDNNKMNGIPIPTGYWKIVTVDGTTKYYYADNIDKGPVVEKKPVPIASLLPK